MEIVKDKTAMIYFKKETQAINEFGFHMFACIKGLKVMQVPEDLFGKNNVEMLQIMDTNGNSFNIPSNFIERIRYIRS